MAKRITCERCKKRRRPWYHYHQGLSVHKYYLLRWMNMSVRITLGSICEGCLDGVFGKIEEALKETK